MRKLILLSLGLALTACEAAGDSGPSPTPTPTPAPTPTPHAFTEPQSDAAFRFRGFLLLRYPDWGRGHPVRADGPQHTPAGE